MNRLIPLVIAITLASGCAAPSSREVSMDPVPGRISSARETRDRDTCRRLESLVDRDAGFVFEIARDCNVALGQILDSRSTLASFDVARAYLDALHDYANTVDFLDGQDDRSKIASDFGAYLIGQQTGLIGAMQDWRAEHGMRKYPSLYQPVRQTMV